MRLHSLGRAFSEMERPAKIYLFSASLLLVAVLCRLAFFDSGSAWLRIAMPHVTETLLGGVLLALFGSIVLDLAYKELRKKSCRK